MSRSKDLSLVDRNLRIVAEVTGGQSLQAVAGKYGLSKQRVSQLVQESRNEVSDDASRDIYLTTLEGWLAHVQDTITDPGFVVSPGGTVVCEPSGELDSRNRPIPDPSRPLIDKQTRLKAISEGVRVLERISRFNGLDRNKQRETDQSAEMSEFLAHIAELEEFRRQHELPILEAEVIQDS